MPPYHDAIVTVKLRTNVKIKDDKVNLLWKVVNFSLEVILNHYLYRGGSCTQPQFHSGGRCTQLQLPRGGRWTQPRGILYNGPEEWIVPHQIFYENPTIFSDFL